MAHLVPIPVSCSELHCRTLTVASFSLDRNVLSNYSVLCRAELLKVHCLILTIHICPFYILQNKDLTVNIIGTWENIKQFEEEGSWARQQTSRRDALL